MALTTLQSNLIRHYFLKPQTSLFFRKRIATRKKKLFKYVKKFISVFFFFKISKIINIYLLKNLHETKNS